MITARCVVGTQILNFPEAPGVPDAGGLQDTLGATLAQVLSLLEERNQTLKIARHSFDFAEMPRALSCQ